MNELPAVVEGVLRGGNPSSGMGTGVVATQIGYIAGILAFAPLWGRQRTQKVDDNDVCLRVRSSAIAITLWNMGLILRTDFLRCLTQTRVAGPRKAQRPIDTLANSDPWTRINFIAGTYPPTANHQFALR